MHNEVSLYNVSLGSAIGNINRHIFGLPSIAHVINRGFIMLITEKFCELASV